MGRFFLRLSVGALPVVVAKCQLEKKHFRRTGSFQAMQECAKLATLTDGTPIPGCPQVLAADALIGFLLGTKA